MYPPYPPAHQGLQPPAPGAHPQPKPPKKFQECFLIEFWKFGY